MRKIFLLLIIGVILISVFYWQYAVRENVIKLMKEELEFCEIIKEELWFDGGKFWLYCNGRPFYTELESGELKYEMNGWSFLENQQDVLSGLNENNCDFQYSKYKELFFYCKSDLVRTYDFNYNDFKFENMRDDNFENVFTNTFIELYYCDAYDFSKPFIDGEDFYSLNLNCSGYDTVVTYNLNKSYFSLPIIVDDSLTGEEKANTAFKILGVCRLDGTDTMIDDYYLDIFCGTSEENFVIYFKDFQETEFFFSVSEFENTFYLFRRRVFPFLDQSKKIEYITSKDLAEKRLDFYKSGKRIIVTDVDSGSYIDNIYLKDEGFNGDKY